MKQIRKGIALLFVVIIFASLVLTGCTAPRHTYDEKAIFNQVSSAAKARVRMSAGVGDYEKYQVSKQKDGRKTVEAITVDTVTNDGDIWTAVGTAILENSSDASEKISVNYELKVQLIDFVTETPMLKYIDFTMEKAE